MTRDQFEHAVRAAGAVLGTDEILVIGSQALHGSVEEPLPEEALRSVEVDVAVPGDQDGEHTDLIDGSIGGGSMYRGTFGYYAQGVVEATAVLPDGWRDRLIPFETPGTGRVTAGAWTPTTSGSPRRLRVAPRTWSFAKLCFGPGWWTGRPCWNAWPSCPSFRSP